MTSYLITWKPLSENNDRGWAEDELVRLADECSSKGYAQSDWRFLRQKGVKPGERVFLLQQGKRGPSILGFGTIVRAKTHQDDGTEIKFDRLLDPRKRQCLVTEGELHAISPGRKLWGAQGSGIGLPDEVAAALERLVKREPLPQMRAAPEDSKAGNGRLPAGELEKVQADHLFKAVQLVLAGESGDFEDSIAYDLVLDDGTRLPPKKVFGIAAGLALGYEILPHHFTGGEDSSCFRILRKAGYEVLPKPEGKSSGDGTPKMDAPRIPATAEDREWTEGRPRLIQHLKRERGSGIAQAKKDAFRREHDGRLACERCGLDPVAQFGGQHGEACIEVHHSKPVGQMKHDDRTRLEDLQCLCANCHRIVHRLLRSADEKLDPS
jgi:hypothetical protein